MEVTLKTIHDCAIELISYAGHDHMPATAARVSFGKDLEDHDSERDIRDIKLMKYLADHEHMSCFEHQTATFMIECPLFIRSQIHRHRTFSYNEISRRYTSEELEFWVPDLVRGQATNNKQGSTEPLENQTALEGFSVIAEASLEDYTTLIELGVCREQARAILPQSLLTRFYMTGNLRNWAHFLKLRLDAHAQYEVRVIAQRIHATLECIWPNSMGALSLDFYDKP